MILGLALIQLVLCAASALASTSLRFSATAALSDLTYLDGGHSEVGSAFQYCKFSFSFPDALVSPGCNRRSLMPVRVQGRALGRCS